MMLTVLNSTVRSVRFIRCSSIRLLSTNDIISNQDCSLKSRQSFPNYKLKEKVQDEFRKSQKRILTIPNILTFSRIAATPAIGYFIWNGMHSQALTCFAFAAVTDLLDGYIARRFNQDSDLGAIMDPIADKLLLTTCFLAIYNTDLMPLWLVKGYISRDMLILLGGVMVRYSGFTGKPSLRQFMDFKNYPTIGFEPTFVSKCNTALQCLLIVLHLSTYHMVGVPVYDTSMFCLQFVTVGTATFSLGQYVKRFLAFKFEIKPPRSRG